MVGLNDVVQILDLSMQRRLRAFVFLLQFGQSRSVGWRLAGVDDRWLFPDFQAVQRLAQEALRRRRVGMSR